MFGVQGCQSYQFRVSFVLKSDCVILLVSCILTKIYTHQHHIKNSVKILYHYDCLYLRFKFQFQYCVCEIACVCLKCLCFVSASEERIIAEICRSYSVHGRWSNLHKITYLITQCSTVLLEKVTVFSQSRNSPNFMEPECSLPHSQGPANCPYQIDPVHNHTFHFLKIHFNITIPSLPESPKRYLSLRFPHQKPVYASPLSHTRYMSRPSHSSRFYHPKNIG